MSNNINFNPQQSKRDAIKRVASRSRRWNSVGMFWSTLWAVGYFTRGSRVLCCILIVLASLWAQADLAGPVGLPITYTFEHVQDAKPKTLPARTQKFLAGIALTLRLTHGPTEAGGFTGPTTTPDPVGDSGAVNYPCQAIAKTSFISGQRFSSVFDIWSWAFHAEDIHGGTFSVMGGLPVALRRGADPYDGDTTYTWYVSINPADYSEGVKEGELILYPVNGVPIVLPRVTWINNPSGTGRYGPTYAYVASTGNNGTATVAQTRASPLLHPFTTHGDAVAGVKAFRLANFGLNDADHAEIMCAPEAAGWDISAASAGVVDGWCTFTAAPGHDNTDTIIRDGAGSVGLAQCNGLHFQNVRLENTTGASGVINNSGGFASTAILWYDSNVVVGPGRGYKSAYIHGANWAAIYYTDNAMSDLERATSSQGAIVVGNTVSRISDDALLGTFALHNTFDDVNPFVPLLNGIGPISTSSTTSNTIGQFQTLTFTIGTGLADMTNYFVTLDHDANNKMIGLVTAYNSGTGAMTVTTNGSSIGSGTYTSWSVVVLSSGHADFWQTYNFSVGAAAYTNTIIYGNVGTNLHYQGFFVYSEFTASIANRANGMAIIKNRISGLDDVDLSRPWSSWGLFVDHLLMIDNDFGGVSFQFVPETGPDGNTVITHFKCTGNQFNQYLEQADFVVNIDFSQSDGNYFIKTAGDSGASVIAATFGTNAHHGARP
jgi:hypothetical protein